LRHLVSIEDLSREEIEEVFGLTDDAKNGHIRKYDELGLKAGLLFFEPSTRTRQSFENAFKELGIETMGFASSAGTSIEKGESKGDTVMLYVKSYGCNFIVVRSKERGVARYFMKLVGDEACIINAGDGANEHPTQALLDLYTIKELHGKIDGLIVGFMGDLRNSRVYHSNLLALLNYDINEIILICPETLRLPFYYELRLKMAGVSYRYASITEWKEIIKEMDVLYVTRIQKERFSDPLEYERVKGSYRLTLESLDGAKDNLIILHPLPRIDEIDLRIDQTPYAAYWKQAENGYWVRIGLIEWLVEENYG